MFGNSSSKASGIGAIVMAIVVVIALCLGITSVNKSNNAAQTTTQADVHQTQTPAASSSAVSSTASKIDSGRLITVTGSNTVTVSADTVSFNVIISHEATTGMEAQTPVAEALEQVIGKLYGLGVTQDMIRTSAMSLDKVWRTEPDAEDKNISVPYMKASYTIDIKLPLSASDKMPKIVDTLSQISDTEVSEVVFTKADTTVEESAARIAAAKDAYDKALEYARAIEPAAKIQLRELNETSTNQNAVMLRTASSKIMTADIPSSDVKVSAEVSATFAIIN